MNQRIVTTHFIEVWTNDSFTIQNENCIDICKLEWSLKLSKLSSNGSTIALFLIREKTPQEKQQSIYYPLNETV